MVFSLSNRWHSDWYDGEKGPAGGRSHQSPRTCTKAGLQIPPRWEAKSLFFYFNITTNQDTGKKHRGHRLARVSQSHRQVLGWEVWFRLQWSGSAALTNGFFIVLLLPPAPYVKVYLLNNGAYVAKKKTKIARKTLDPLYQQALLFEESPQGKVLQVRPRYIFPFLPRKLFNFLQILTESLWGYMLLFSVTLGDFIFSSGDCVGGLRPNGP